MDTGRARRQGTRTHIGGAVPQDRLVAVGDDPDDRDEFVTASHWIHRTFTALTGACGAAWTAVYVAQWLARILPAEVLERLSDALKDVVN